MPYATDVIGIYKIVNTATQQCYVGQSQRCKKRIADHFNLLEKGKHPNPILQRSYAKHGKNVFVAEIEVECEDTLDLDNIEGDFLVGIATFEQPSSYNIATVPWVPMRGRAHTDITKRKISDSKRENPPQYTPEIKAKLSKGQLARRFAVPGYTDKLKAIIKKRNEGATFASIAKEFGYSDPTSVCVLYHRYKNVKDF